MPTRNALTTARLSYVHPAPGAPYHVTLEVRSHSFDHPDPARRSALVTEVYLTQLAPSSSYLVSNLSIKDRYGVDHDGLWAGTGGFHEVGFKGYTEYDTAGACGPDLPGVFWGAFTGIYDERCLADPATDARRLQTYRSSPTQVGVFNYLLGPVTFAFDIALPSPPTAVRLKLGLIGGNGGHPAQRTPGTAIPDEEFVIKFP
jgi:hypothetical protein